MLTTVLCLLTTQIVYAQKKVCYLEAIWQKTLQQYPSLSSKKSQVEFQQLNKALIKKEWLPEVMVQAQQSYGSSQCRFTARSDTILIN